nr:uncharacterized protein LOC111995710 [Quercus suber]
MHLAVETPTQLRHFIWKACRNILATKDNLKRRKISVDDEYVLCGQPEETTCHLLWFCKHARGVWESSKLALPFAISPSWMFLDVVQNLQKGEGSQPGLTERVISVCWGIWKDCNERRIGGNGKPSREILKTSLHHVDEYHAANEVRQDDALKAIPMITWRPPN